MKQENTSMLLVLFLVLGGVMYPQVASQQPADKTGSPPVAIATPQAAAPPGGRPCRRSAAELIGEYLGKDIGTACTPGAGPDVEFLIATVPDPLDAQTGYLFDDYLDPLQRAIVSSGYLLDRYSLPWECPRDDAAKSGTRTHTEQPGVVLFRHPKQRPLVLFLIGETPTAGIHKRALAAALNQIEQCLPTANDDTKKTEVRIVGPSFSGSVSSLMMKARGWLAEGQRNHFQFRIVSGSATSAGDRSTYGDSISFRGTVVPVGAQFKALYHYLREELGANADDVALLRESGTSYSAASVSTKRDPGTFTPRLDLPFPMHISQTRAAYEHDKRFKNNPADNGIATTPETTQLQLSLDELGQPRDTIPAFAPAMTANYADLIIANLLSTISRESIRYVGLLASDTRDKLFLARRIRQYCPDVRLFTVNSDFLLAHPQYNLDLAGMIVASTYPLFNQNQRWTHRGEGGDQRFLFATNGAEGTYNATLALLDYDRQGKPLYPNAAPDLLEYTAPPFLSDRSQPYATRRPPVWLTIVGNGGFWPLRFVPDYDDFDDSDSQCRENTLGDPLCDQKGYVLRLAAQGSAKQTPPVLSSAILWNVLFGFILLLCLAHCEVFRRARRRVAPLIPPRSERPPMRDWFRPRACRLCRRSQRLYVLACFLVLLMVYALLSPVAAVPWRVHLHSMQQPGPGAGSLWRLDWFVLVFLTIPLAALVIAAVAAALDAGSGSETSAASDLSERTCVHQVGCPAARRWLQTSRLHWVLAPAVRRQVWNALLVALALLGAGGSVWLFAHSVFLEPLATAVMRYERATNTASGLSSTVPVLLFGSGLYLWALCHLRRLHLIETVNLSLPLARSASSIHVLERLVRYAVQHPLRSIPLGMLVTASAFAGVPLWLLHERFLPTFEGHDFDWLCEYVWFPLYWLAVIFAFTQFLWLWFQFRRLLRRLASHPLVEVYGRLPIRTSNTVGGRFSAHPPNLDDIGGWVRHWSLLARNFSFNRTALAETLDTPTVENRLPQLCADPDTIERMFACEQDRLARRGGRAAVSQSETRRWLTDAARILVSGLQPYWMTRGVQRNEAEPRATLANVQSNESGPKGGGDDGKKGKSESPDKRDDKVKADDPTIAMFMHSSTAPADIWIRLAEDFIALQVVAFVSDIFAHLRNLLTFVTLAVVLMLLAFTSYSFQPQQLLMYLSWVVIVGITAGAMIVFVQIERDEVLSRISKTDPNKVQFDWAFVSRVLTYAVLPILALVAAQFPQLGRFLGGILHTLR